MLLTLKTIISVKQCEGFMDPESRPHGTTLNPISTSLTNLSLPKRTINIKLWLKALCDVPASSTAFSPPVNLQQLLHLAGDLIHDPPNNFQFFKLHTVFYFFQSLITVICIYFWSFFQISPNILKTIIPFHNPLILFFTVKIWFSVFYRV